MRRMTATGGKRGLVTSMEAENNADKPKNDEIGNNAESLETDMLEVADADADAEADATEVEEAVETKEALENLQVVLESAIEQGGLDQQGAAGISILLQHMNRRAGVNKPKGLPALESFGGTSSRLRATSLALEDVKDTVRQIWQAICDYIEKAKKWIVERYTEMFGAANKLEKRAEALKARANNDTPGTQKGNVENERLVKALHVAGSVSKITTGLAAVAALGETVFRNDTKVVEELAVAFESGETEKVGAALNTASKAYNETIGKALTDVSNPAAEGLQEAGNGMKVVRSAEFPGGRAIVGRVSATSGNGSLEEVAETLSKTWTKVGEFKPKQTAPTTTSLPALSINDAETICKTVVSMAQAIQTYKAKLDSIGKIEDRIVKAGRKFGSDAKNENDEGKAKAMKALQKIGGSLSKIIDEPAYSFSAYSISTGKAALDYVEESLKKYSDKAAK